jgi:dienelactone hydrolase
MRLATIVLGCAGAALAAIGGATAQTIVREELPVPMAEAGPRGLEALLVRARERARYPLALINHGAPRDNRERAGMTPLAFVPQALEFARRGFAVLIVMRRGYGDSGGNFSEGIGSCENPDYVKAARASAADLKAALAGVAMRDDVDAGRTISVGLSAGAFANIALASAPPQGLLAAINFAGGLGSPEPDKICREDGLLAAHDTFGKSARVPMLWVYAANDHYFGPPAARRMHDAFTAAGGKAEFVAAPAFGDDGHLLFLRPGGIALWTTYVDAFLKQHDLMPRTQLLALPSAGLRPPTSLSVSGRTGFEEFRIAAPHKAFAVAPSGAWDWWAGRRTVDEARMEALARCSARSPGCKVVVIDDSTVP